MSNITINTKARTIEINKTFAAASSKFGSDEYLELQDARRDYPNFRVVTIAQKAAKTEFKGLTYDYMKSYIKAHDDEANSKMATFLMLRGLDEEGLAAGAASADYSDIKDWFLGEFPAIKGFHDKRADILKKVAAAKEKKAADEKAKKLAALAA